MSELFHLLGHDCPLGTYPAPVVPVGRLGDKLVAIYATTSGAEVVEVAPDAHFTLHDSDTEDVLRNFSHRNQRLFAYDANHVVAYNVSQEHEFYARVLSNPSDEIRNPFLRLALAKATRDAGVVRRELTDCAKYLAASAPDLVPSWYEQERASAVKAGIEDYELPRDAGALLERLDFAEPEEKGLTSVVPNVAIVTPTKVATRRASSKIISVCILSPHPSVLGEFERILAKASQFMVIPKQLESTPAPDLRSLDPPKAQVYVIDAHVGRQATGALLTNILERFADAHLIVVGDAVTAEAYGYSLLRQGVKGILTYTEAREQLFRALPLVANGGFWVPRALLSGFVDSVLTSQGRRLKSDSVTSLSRREQEVLDSLLENLSNKEIANKLNIAERTVKFHVSNLLSKFGVRRRADLIFLTLQRIART
jgi:DNA-binding NarL/FixJ family response regulator